MGKIILTAILTFIATELDDFAVYVLLFARQKNQRRAIFLGQITTLAIISAACAFLSIPLSRIPPQYLRFIGIVPVFMGIWTIFKKDDEDDDETKSFGTGAFLTSMFLTFSSSADNLGIYIPYFTNLQVPEKISAIIVFLILQCLWSFLQIKTANIPVVQKIVEKTSRILVPVIFILLGIMIIFF